jgi:hypothetical protein
MRGSLCNFSNWGCPIANAALCDRNKSFAFEEEKHIIDIDKANFL